MDGKKEEEKNSRKKFSSNILSILNTHFTLSFSQDFSYPNPHMQATLSSLLFHGLHKKQVLKQ